ncbi:MAG: BadF/BadG/BcrA/BcrD ATPase family protein [Devosia sp.]
MSGTTILGVDGGGSKTLIAVADASGTVIRMRRGEGINPLDNRRWRADFEAQFRAFGAVPNLAGAAVALPSYGEVEEISAAQRAATTTALGDIPQRVLNDVDAAHIGAFAGGPGILILSGTGSMAWARDAGGTSFRVGGWGDLIGDEGSSHWIGMQVLGLVTRALDGRVDMTGLVDALFDFLRLDRSQAMNSIEGWVAHLGHARSEIAALAPLVSRLAEAGDAGATGIVNSAAEHLAVHVTTIAKQSRLPLDWSYAGGTFASRALLDAVAKKIGTAPKRPVLPPIGGALLCAAKDLDWPVDEAWIGRLAASIKQHASPAQATTADQLQPQP